MDGHGLEPVFYRFLTIFNNFIHRAVYAWKFKHPQLRDNFFCSPKIDPRTLTFSCSKLVILAATAWNH